MIGVRRFDMRAPFSNVCARGRIQRKSQLRLGTPGVGAPLQTNFPSGGTSGQERSAPRGRRPERRGSLTGGRHETNNARVPAASRRVLWIAVLLLVIAAAGGGFLRWSGRRSKGNGATAGAGTAKGPATPRG